MYTRIALGFAALLFATTTHAGVYDGTRSLMCSVYQLYECDPPNGCIAVTPGEIRGVSHLDLDFDAKVITRAEEESAQRSPMQRITTIDGKLVIQGVEDGVPGERDGAGWSVSIMDPEGTMVLSSAADGFAVVGLGACAPK